MDVDKEYQELVSKTLKRRVPVLERGTPSMYSKDGKHLYLKSFDLAVGSDPGSFGLAKSLFESTFRSPPTRETVPASYNLQKDYERALDQELLARWIKTKFSQQADKELKAKIRKVLGGEA